MDIAFAPGPTAFDTAIKNLFKRRAQTTVIDEANITTVRNLVVKLNNRTTQTVVTNILIGTHGDDNAFMSIQFNGAFGDHTTYEDLIKEMNSANRPCQVDNPVINPRPVDANNQPIPPFLLIKGCRIGQSLPFLNKIRDAINGLSQTTIQVVAPKFFEVVGPQPQGSFEFLYYDFNHFSKTPVADKAALVAIMQGKNLKDIAGTAIPPAKWTAWIPRRIDRNKDDIQTVNLTPPPIAGLPTAPMGRYKYATPVVFTYNIHLSSGSIPAAEPDRIALLKTQVQNLAANPGTNLMAQSLVASHPFPFYQRFGYADMNSLIDDLFWTFAPNAKDPLNMLCTGRRHEYNVNPPIVVSGTDDLIFNYYAANASGTTSVKQYDDLDPRFFAITT